LNPHQATLRETKRLWRKGRVQDAGETAIVGNDGYAPAFAQFQFPPASEYVQLQLL
jgi:hypothetical protein